MVEAEAAVHHRSNGNGIVGRYDRPFDDQLMGIAVPILARGRVHATINILWVRRAMTVNDLVVAHLKDLQQAADEIAVALKGEP